MKKHVKAISLVLLTVMLIGIITGCTSTTTTQTDASTPTPGSTENTAATTKTPDTSKEVNLIYYFWGSAGVANKDIIKAINDKLKPDINAIIDIKYIDWGDVATKYPLLFASGEQFDLTEASPTFPVSYYTIASQKAVADITDMLDYVPVLKAEIPEKAWNYTKVNGKINAVPTLYVAFNAYGFITRSDLTAKYNLKPVNSVDTAEAYLDAVATGGDMIPMNGNSAMAINNYRMFVTTTGTWFPDVPGIANGELNLIAKSAKEFKDILHPAFTQQFEDFAVKMREWADKGYWGKDVLSSPTDNKTNFLEGMSAAYITHQPDWTGSYGTVTEKLPGIETNFWCFSLDNGKMKRMPPTENLTVISSTSKNPERALLVVEKFMTDESYYRLLQYGIEGRQYEVVDGVVKTPASFNADVDAGGFAAWAPRNNRLNLPLWFENPIRAIQNKDWDKIAIDDPYIGFAFNPKNVTTELAAITNVNAQLGIQLMLGKTTEDPKAAVVAYREQLKQAGIEKVIAEIKKQLDEFFPGK